MGRVFKSRGREPENGGKLIYWRILAAANVVLTFWPGGEKLTVRYYSPLYR